MSRKAQLGTIEVSKFPNTRFPVLHVSDRRPLGHSVTAHAISPAKIGQWRCLQGFEPRSIVCLFQSVARALLQVKLLLRGVPSWPLFFTRR